jgi:hypothetical protein
MKIIGVAVLALVVAIPSVAFAQDDNRAAGGIGGALPGARRRAVQQQCAMVAESVPWCVIVIAHGPILPDEFLIAERVVEAEAVLMSPRRSPCPFTRVVSVREATSRSSLRVERLSNRSAQTSLSPSGVPSAT